jgi:ankyrin repeat protein
MLTAGANTETKDNNGSTALIIASQYDNGECVDLLLTAGAEKEAKTQKGFTTLYMAALNGHNKCVELLLNAGCDVNAVDDDGVSALNVAVHEKHIDCVRTLVRCGADVTMQFDGFSLNDFVDNTTMADALKAALRLPAEKRRHCEQCDKTTFGKRMKKCGACRKARYCNRECQVANW